MKFLIRTSKRKRFKCKRKSGFNTLFSMFQNKCCGLHFALGITFHQVQLVLLYRVTILPLKREEDRKARIIRSPKPSSWSELSLNCLCVCTYTVQIGDY